MYLQADTQIYVPMMERIYNPVVLSNDPMIARAHGALGLTAYDEIVIALRNYAGLDFEYSLKALQFLFRACTAAGLLLIALRLGLSPPGALCAVGLIILNAGTLGQGISETDPVARSFALGLLLLGVGLAVNDRFLLAGVAGGLAFLIHLTTAAPFWAVAVFVVLRRGARPILLAPLLPAAGLLLVLAHFQAGGNSSLDFFHTVGAFQMALQRIYTGLSFVTEGWEIKRFLDFLCECTAAGAAFWRLRDRLRPPLRDWFWGFTAIAVVSVPTAYIALEQLHWAMAVTWDPMRTLLYITLLVSLFAAACGIFAAEKGIWWEAPLWFSFALVLPVKDILVTKFVDPRLIVLVAALVAAITLGAWFAARTRGWTLAAAAILPFVAFPLSGLVPPVKIVDTPELKEMARWARTSTDETAMFLFADEGAYGGSGPFRARALRSIYADYEGRAVVGYYEQYAVDWMQRWRDVHEGHWIVRERDFQDLAERKIDFVVLKKEHAIPGRQPEFANSHYVVYRVRSVF